MYLGISYFHIVHNTPFPTPNLPCSLSYSLSVCGHAKSPAKTAVWQGGGGRRMIKTMCARDSKTWFPDTVHCWQPSVYRVVLLFDKWAIWLRVSKRSEMGWDQWEERELQLSLILFSLLPTRCNHSPSRVALFSHVIGLFCFHIALSKERSCEESIHCL